MELKVQPTVLLEQLRAAGVNKPEFRHPGGEVGRGQPTTVLADRRIADDLDHQFWPPFELDKTVGLAPGFRCEPDPVGVDRGIRHGDHVGLRRHIPRDRRNPRLTGEEVVAFVFCHRAKHADNFSLERAVREQVFR
jgi:hypothetical protein